MIISCDNCSKRYLLDEAALGTAERILRCAACGHSWTYVPVVGHEALVASMNSQEGERAVDGIAADVRRGYASLGLLFGLFLTIALMGSYFARAQIATVWPESVPIFQFLGVYAQSSAQGLLLRGVHPLQSKASNAHNQVVLVGEVVNTSAQATPLLPLKIKGYGACEQAPFLARARAQVVSLFTKQSPACVLTSWTHSLTESRLLPEERLSFQTQPHPLPKGVLRVVLEF